MVEVSDQSEVRAFLLAAMAETGDVEEIETHISYVFVGPDRAWKLKRAVLLPYADFSTPDKRQALCEREVTLNRRTAPDHYLGVRQITRQDGKLGFDGPGDVIDCIVEMRSFDQDALFDRLASRGALTAALMEELAVEIARLHETCPQDTRPGSERVAEVLAINEAALAQTGVFPPEEVAQFNAGFRAAARAHRKLLDRRSQSGQVRLAHGDLHLRNIFLANGRPVLFDCIEFNDALATTDLLYDLAFLLMDLVHRDLPGFANLVMNRYLDLTGSDEGLPLLPFFMALRAAVRAHVTATAIEQGADSPCRRKEARDYFDLARRLLRPEPAVLVALGGLSGSGKSTLAASAAPMIGTGAGARILSSDRLRKALHGVAPETRLPPAAYRPEVSTRVYHHLVTRAQDGIRAGACVLVDAVFSRAGERQQIEAAAEAAQVPFFGFWLDADASVLRARVAARLPNPSDATVSVLESQLGYDIGEIRWTRLDASLPTNTLAGTILDATRIPRKGQA